MSSSVRDPRLWLLVTANLAIKTPLLWLNQAEYTDGLILLRLFENRCPFYMPLTTALCRAVEWTGAEPVLAGRIVSLVAHVATLFPLFAAARWLTGSRAAALWSAVLYSLSPVPCRWGVRVMTDSLFGLLWWMSLAAFLESVRVRERASVRACGRTLTFGALAALTRQTGWILLPLGILGLLRARRARPRWSAAVLVLWALPLGWMVWVGSFGGHGGQVAQRFTWAASVSMIESYAGDWPLFVSWPIALLAAWALFRPAVAGQRWWWFLGVMAWCVLGVLALQCLIQSYLARYLLPLVGFVCILAGASLARLGAEHPRWLLPVAAITLVWVTLLTGSSLWLQRTAWGDFREGAIRMGAIATPSTLCFTNESYPTWPAGGTTKAEWWSDHPVQSVFVGRGDQTHVAELPSESLVLLSTAYGGSAAVGRLFDTLSSLYTVEVVGEWERRLVPLLPDIMDGRFQPLLGLHQNPLAMRFRHVPQQFWTLLIRITGPRNPPA
jgi:hypothetical protein